MSMTTAERKATREALIATGWHRTAQTFDAGDGVYTESWQQGVNTITLIWGPKAHDVREDS